MIITMDIAEPIRIDRWLRRQYVGLPQSMVEKMLRKGTIRLNGHKTTANVRLQQGDQVSLPEGLEKFCHPETAPPSELSIRDEAFITSLILWEDERLLVLNKPARLAVQGGTKTPRHLDGLLRQWGRKTGYRYRLVHRLDRDTTGVFLVAKTEEMAAYLGHLFQDNRIKKIYWALVKGTPPSNHGTIDLPLAKGMQADQERMHVDPKRGKKAVTHYRLCKRLGNQAWVEFRPETGRTHQIRVHAAAIGCPLVGDSKYGSPSDQPLCLHARSITFVDPEGAQLTFTAPAPDYFPSES